VFAGYRGDVIQAIKIGKGLTVSLVFDQFFGAAVEETDMGVQIPHKLQVERSNEVVKFGTYLLRRQVLLSFGDNRELLGDKDRNLSPCL
jgi:hypothetical protein